MKINVKVRLKNGPWLGSFIGFIVATVYQLPAMFDIAPVITQSEVMQVVAVVLQLLGLLGVITDPTTKGISDSERALKYTDPA